MIPAPGFVCCHGKGLTEHVHSVRAHHATVSIYSADRPPRVYRHSNFFLLHHHFKMQKPCLVPPFTALFLLAPFSSSSSPSSSSFSSSSISFYSAASIYRARARESFQSDTWRGMDSPTTWLSLAYLISHTRLVLCALACLL